jgi:uncharacterized protein (TIGR03437 family)
VKYAQLVVMLPAVLAGQGFWEGLAPVPGRLVSPAAVSLDRTVLVACSPQLGLSLIHEYNAVTDGWTVAGFHPAGSPDECRLAVANGRWFTTGVSRNGLPLGTIWEFDPGSARWSVVGQWGVPRLGSGLVSEGSRIWMVGGHEGQGRASAAVERLDVETKQVTRLPDLPEPRNRPAAVLLAGRLHVLGGTGESDSDTRDTHFRFDPAAGTWTRLAPLPTARSTGATVLGGRIVVAGGAGDRADEWDPATNQWRRLAGMGAERSGAAVVTAAGKVLVLGGANLSISHQALHLPAGPPALNAVRNGASFSEGLAPGSIVTLFGESLGVGERIASAVPLPVTMNAVEVSVNGVPASLQYAGPRQINLILPSNLVPGPATLRLTVAGTTATRDVMILDSAPGIFTRSQDGAGQGAILVGGRLADRDRPAKRGETVEIYLTGLNGARPTVLIGGTEARVAYAGPVAGIAGLDQINAVIPAAGFAAGNGVSLEVVANGRASNRVALAVVD